MRRVIPLSGLAKRGVNQREASRGSHTREPSVARTVVAQSRTMSGCRPAESASRGTEDVMTPAGADTVADRLDRAIRELGDKEQQIRVLEQELELLKSGAPERLEPPPDPVIGPAAEAPDLDATARDPEGQGGSIQWHSVLVSRELSERPSIFPRSQRRAERRQAELHVEFDSDTQFYTGITQDISEGGVFIATYCVQPIGTKLGLSFELPCGTHIETQGTVRWIRDPSSNSRPGMGVAFGELPDESIAAIARFCQRNAPLYVEV